MYVDYPAQQDIKEESPALGSFAILLVESQAEAMMEALTEATESNPGPENHNAMASPVERGKGIHVVLAKQGIT